MTRIIVLGLSLLLLGGCTGPFMAPINRAVTAQANKPVMSVRMLEHGLFASALLRSDKPFDPEKLEVGFIGTCFQHVVNSI